MSSPPPGPGDRDADRSPRRARLGTRTRVGLLAWALTPQFFVAEAVAAARFDGRYSYADDVISELGATGCTAELCSPAHAVMNGSFVLQGVLVLGGAVLLAPLLRDRAGRLARTLLAVCAVGVVVVAAAPLDGNGTAHAIGATAYLIGSGAGLVALGRSLTRRPAARATQPGAGGLRLRRVGSAVAALGVLGLLGTAAFGLGLTGALGEGATERVAAYVLPLGLTLAAVVTRRTPR